MVRNPPADAGVTGDTGLIPGPEDPLVEEMATHCSTLAWKIPWTEEPGGLQFIGLQSLTRLSMHTHSIISYEYSTIHNFYGHMSSSGEGNGNPLQYSCLENPTDGGVWWAVVHGVTSSRTLLSDFTFTFHFHALEKEMATHSSILAWRIPEPGGLPSMGSHRVGHD